jgi:hypothetical protein
MILTVPCSHVGVLNLHDPIKVTELASVQRIASVWFGTHSATVLGAIGADKKIVRSKLSTMPRCDVSSGARDIDWYLAHVASNLIIPSVDAIKFGFLRVKTGRCARRLKSTDRIALEDCHAHLFTRPAKDMIFELTRQGHLKVTGKCVTVQPNAYLLALDCVQPEDIHQTWQYSGSGQLINSWSHYCATHVTDPDRNAPGDRQIAMAQDCASPSQAAGTGGETSDSLQFTTWQFLAL